MNWVSSISPMREGIITSHSPFRTGSQILGSQTLVTETWKSQPIPAPR